MAWDVWLQKDVSNKTCPHIGEKCQLTSNIQWVGAILKQQKRSPLSLKQSLLTSLVKVNLLIMAGDLELNPGPKRPIKYPCGECRKAVKSTHRAVQCDSCDIWLHKDCMGMCSTVYRGLQGCSASWICHQCGLPNFDTSIFGTSSITLGNSYGSLSEYGDRTDPGSPVLTSSPKKPAYVHKTKHPPLKLLNINFRSIKNKKAEFLNLIECEKPDIIVGTESWLEPDITDSEIFPDNYTARRRDRTGQAYGGVFIATKDDYITSRAPELETEAEDVWIKMEVKGCKTIRIGGFYRNKVSDNKSVDDLEECLTKLEDCQGSNIIMAGDYNFPDWDWQHNTIKQGCKHVHLHQRFKTLLDTNCLEQLVVEPTRENNTLDLVITNNTRLVDKIEVIPGLSDHDIVRVQININPVRTKQQPTQIPLYKKAKWDFPSPRKWRRPVETSRSRHHMPQPNISGESSTMT